MYKRILVPVDGSGHSLSVLPWASGLARSAGAELALLRLVSDPAELDGARADLAPIAERLNASHLCEPTAGDIADAILWEASQVPETLVTICSHGRSGALEALLGSVAMRMLRNSTEPIMIYRPIGAAATSTDDARIGNIVVPLDGSESSRSIVPYAVRLAQTLAARLTIVSVVQPAQASGLPATDVLESSFVQAQANEIEREYGFQSAGWEVLHGDPAEAIPAFMGLQKNAALAMASRGQGALKTALFGSVTAACLRRSGVPVFTRIP
jgi:nucleotide-binding universal stress UspA family protein